MILGSCNRSMARRIGPYPASFRMWCCVTAGHRSFTGLGGILPPEELCRVSWPVMRRERVVSPGPQEYESAEVLLSSTPTQLS